MAAFLYFRNPSLNNMKSLLDLCILKILTLFWDKDLALRKISVMDKSKQLIYLKINNVRKDLSKLPLPESLKNKIFVLIEPFGEEIISWTSFHMYRNNLLRNKYSSGELIWCKDWTVDKVKTAERIIRGKYESIRSSYFLACIYCIEDHIRKLWGQLRMTEKPRMMNCTCALVAFWSHIMAERNVQPLINKYCQDRPSLNQFGFRISSMMFNEVATKYFWTKLTDEEKEAEVHTSIIDIERFSDSRVIYKPLDSPYTMIEDKTRVICFIDSQRSKEKQQRNPFTDLEKYLCWPWLNHFMDVAQISYQQKFMTTFRYNEILKCMTSKYYTCNILFQDFWNNSPLEMRQNLKFSILDQNNLRLMFSNNRERSKNWIIYQMASVKEPFSLGYRDLIKFALSSSCFSMDDFTELEKELPEVSDKHLLATLML